MINKKLVVALLLVTLAGSASATPSQSQGQTPHCWTMAFFPHFGQMVRSCAAHRF